MLELKDLCVSYGRHTVLDGVSASFEKGCLTSIIGTNGCGKSTLLKSVLNIVPARSGEITVDGESIFVLRRTDIAKKISYLPQGRSTPDMTVTQMVLHGRFPHLSYPRRYTARDREIAAAAIERVGLSDCADRPLCTLSGGMRQTAYVAMALAQDTDYILLDEPTTYLDVSHQLSLMKTLRELSDAGKGIVVVMHDLPMAFEFSDRVAVMGQGKVILEGSPLDVCGSYAIKEEFGVGVGYHSEEKKFFYRYG